MMYNITQIIEGAVANSLDLESKHTAISVANMTLSAVNSLFRFDLKDFKKDVRELSWTAPDGKLCLKIRRL